MFVKVEVNNYDDLKNMLWGSNCEYTCKKIEEANLEDEFFEFIECMFSDSTYEDNSVNDYVAYDFNESDFINEHLTLDDIDSLEELKEYSDNYNVDMTINNAIANKRDKELWKYLQDNLYGESLKDIFETLEDLTEDIYLPAEYAKSLDELVKFAKETNNTEVIDIVNEVKEIGKEKELWNKIVEEYHNSNYTMMEVFVDLENLDIEEL